MKNESKTNQTSTNSHYIIKRKIWGFNSLDRERDFLNDMSQKGYQLKDVHMFKYRFVSSSTDYQYLVHFKSADAKLPESEYLQIFEDTGLEHVATYGPWYYFQAHTLSTVNRELFNDHDSMVKFYQKILYFLMLSGSPLYFFSLLIFPNLDRHAFFYPIGFIMVIFCVVHLSILLKLFLQIVTLKKKIHE